MGLDTTHGCWNGPYSAFSRFREQLAEAAGIPLNLMEGYYPPLWGEAAWYQPMRSERRENPVPAGTITKDSMLSSLAASGIEMRPSVAGGYDPNDFEDVPSGPPVMVSPSIVSALDWARARNGGPRCGAPEGPALEHFIVEVARWLPIKWDVFADDPIVILLNHGDSDGDIRGTRNQKRLADRLEELAAAFPPEFGRHPDYEKSVGEHGEEYVARGLYDGTRAAALRFAAGLRLAASERKPVLFR